MEPSDHLPGLYFNLLAGFRELERLPCGDSYEVCKAGYREHALNRGRLSRDDVCVENFAGEQVLARPELDLECVCTCRERQVRCPVERISVLVVCHGESASVTARIEQEMFP